MRPYKYHYRSVRKNVDSKGEKWAKDINRKILNKKMQKANNPIKKYNSLVVEEL